DYGEAAVGCARMILVGRMHRGLTRVEVHGMDIEAVVEAFCVTGTAGQRAAEDAHIQSVFHQLLRQRSSHVSGASARKEEEAVQYPHAATIREPGIPTTRSPAEATRRSARRNQKSGRDRLATRDRDLVCLPRVVA